MIYLEEQRPKLQKNNNININLEKFIWIIAFLKVWMAEFSVYIHYLSSSR